MPSGSALTKSSATAFTASIVSIRLAPMRFFTSMAIAGLPSRRVIVSASLKVERTVATSWACTTAFGAGDDRQVGDVLRRFDQRRHLDRVFAFRAFDVPAATRLLDAPTPWISWSSCSP